jgi:hypothetical protein
LASNALPKSHMRQLDMLGEGDIIGTSWDNAAAPIILDLLNIDAAFQNTVDCVLTIAECSSVVWRMVITNQEVCSVAGAMGPVESFQRQTDGTFTGVLRSASWLTWKIRPKGIPATPAIHPDISVRFTTGKDGSGHVAIAQVDF